MKRELMVLVLGACSSASTPIVKPPPPPAPTGDPPIVIGLASGKHVEIVAVTPAGTKTLKSATLRNNISAIAWRGDELLALMEHVHSDQCNMPEEFFQSKAAFEAHQRDCKYDPKDDGIVVRVGERGIAEFTPLPAATWPAPGKPDDKCTNDCWKLHVHGDAVWQSHCIEEFIADGVRCGSWSHARLDVPGPAMTYEQYRALTERPGSPAPEPEPFVVPPSPRVKVTFESVTPPPHYDGDEPEARRQVQCSLDGRAPVAYPPPDKLDLGVADSVRWLSTDPPRFVVEHGHDGFEPYSTTILFEGCEPEAIAGVEDWGDDLLSVDNARLLLRRGQLVGRTSGGLLVAKR